MTSLDACVPLAEHYLMPLVTGRWPTDQHVELASATLL